MVHEAAGRGGGVGTEGTELEVVDLRSVKPLDTDTIMDRSRAQGGCCAWAKPGPGRVTAEVIARWRAKGFGLLDAPPQRLNAKDTPVPYHRTSGPPIARPPQHRRRRAKPAATLFKND